MRVAYVNQDPGIGPGREKGAAVHVAAMQRALRELGCEVLAFEHKRAAELEDALARAHAEGGLDLVYERYALGAEAAGRFARRYGAPHVLEVNAPLLDEARAHRGAEVGPDEVRREARILAGADHVFAVSRAVAEHALELGVPAERVHVHPNAVDATRFRPRDSSDKRRELSIPREAFVVGFHGRLRPWHGFERVVAAARRLVARERPVHVLTVGAGGFAEALAAGGLARRSTCVPWVEHDAMPALVACFDVLPLGYAPDAPCYFSPLKLLEAMACGAVPVVPDLGDLPEAVEHGACGLVYPAGSTAGLVEALDQLWSDADRRRRLSEHAVRRAGQQSWTAIARAALELARRERVR